MRTHVGLVPVEVARAESARFLRPLLLLHGLWTGAWMWQPLAAYLAHRGWESWAPSLLETDHPWLDLESLLASLTEVVRALPAPPILVAHDTGIVPAAALASSIDVPALVAIAPVVAPADAAGDRGIFAWPRFWRVRRAGARVRPPRGVGARRALGVSAEAAGRLVAESGPLFRSLAASRVRLPAAMRMPGLVLSGERDELSRAHLGRRLADRFGWEHRTYAQRGHLLPLERGFEEVADDVHRWLVRTMGAEILALLDESEDV